MIIQLEGCEASGKSTLLNRLIPYFKQKGLSVKSEHYPSDKTPFGKLARNFLSCNEIVGVDSGFLITLAAIADQHIHNLTSEQYQNNSDNAYICSRGVISTLVYSDLHNLQADSFTGKVMLVLDDYVIKPDVVIYLDPPVDVVLSRLARRNSSQKSIYDQANLVKTIKAKYDSVLDCMQHQIDVLRIQDEELLANLDSHLNAIYQFTYKD